MGNENSQYATVKEPKSGKKSKSGAQASPQLINQPKPYAQAPQRVEAEKPVAAPAPSPIIDLLSTPPVVPVNYGNQQPITPVVTNPVPLSPLNPAPLVQPTNPMTQPPRTNQPPQPSRTTQPAISPAQQVQPQPMKSNVVASQPPPQPARPAQNTVQPQPQPQSQSQPQPQPLKPNVVASQPPPQPARPVTQNNTAAPKPGVPELKNFESQLKPHSQLSASACHLQCSGAERVVVECILQIKVPSDVQGWLFYVPIPPLTASQSDGKLSVRVATSNPIYELTNSDYPLQRELLRVVVPAEDAQTKRSLKIGFYFEMTLQSCELIYNPNIQTQAIVASYHDLTVYSADDDENYILMDQRYQQYVTQHANVLFRNPYEVQDQTIIYVQRVFQFLSENFTYDERASDHHILTTIANKKSNSIGLSLLFCAILRGQEVVSRLLVGRNLKDANLKQHTIAEFYVEQVGWVPADLTSMILYGKNKPRANGRLPFFGEANPNFMTFHYETKFALDTLSDSPAKVTSLESIPFWAGVNNQFMNSLPHMQVQTAWKVVKRTPVPK